ncbi:Adenine nucleotide transporter BT1, chloroplastic/mitochondrial [Apostasia shenzhenica]|uniref:Adenine nucleotide transporter BT1, chloroplastic/mitochondrial n=1 Tax=Apostasia shenzhenica TaxID=1088818 RepID=A0A2I0BA42_9ASPA|nr:Adenine nucleotide transporter BT1, chloroplastic/mitochondrial [Apostasia shenzhenica]
MARRNLVIGNKKDEFLLPLPSLNLSWNIEDCFYPPSGLFASIGQTGPSFGISSCSSNPGDNGVRIPFTDRYLKYEAPALTCATVSNQPGSVLGAADPFEVTKVKGKKKKVGLKLRLKVRDPSLRSFISGGIAGAVSRTAVAPLETIRTHLMVGSNGHSTMEVFQSIMKNEGWKGLFRGNFVNVIRVAPSKAIELFAYDTVKKILTPKTNEQPKLPISPSLIAGACAGVSSTLCTYPLELLKTRLTIEKDVYDNLLHAFIKILREEGPMELYRGLTPSLIGVVPYAATNYFAYDMLKKAYRKIFKTEEIGNIPTLLIGSAAGAISSSATFPLEVARKHMQVGAVGGRQVYKSMLHALVSILENEGIGGLYKGLGPSCLKLVPAAGISFMCFEACKKILVDEEN